MIVYTNHCLACTMKNRWRELRHFADTHRLELEERKVSLNEIWRQEAQVIVESTGHELPLIVHGGLILNINDNLEKFL